MNYPPPLSWERGIRGGEAKKPGVIIKLSYLQKYLLLV